MSTSRRETPGGDGAAAGRRRVAPLAERSAPTFPPAVHAIGGELVAGRGEEIETRYPATGELLARLRAADADQTAAAVAAARASFDAGVWRELPAEKRAAVLEGMAEVLAGRREELTRRVVLDNGKTLREGAGDVVAAIAALRAAAGSCRQDRELSLPAERGVERHVWLEPVGVVAAVTPFNAPLLFAALKAAPALAAGNSVVLKPSERAPLLPVALAEAAIAAGLPAGVLNLVQGRADTAAALFADDRVDMISLTGGLGAGRAAIHAAAPTIKNLLLELGGKSAHVVLADADLGAAIAGVAAGIFRNAGQRCFSGSRLIVEESVADEVEAGIAALAGSLVVGDPFEETTDVGAMIDEAAVAAAERFVERALAEGLELAAGGSRRAELAPGSFFRPTVLTGATADSRAAREEVFGPVLTCIRVADAEAAVRVANATRYGLAGGVWTGDPARALAFARRIRCGYFWINTYGAVFGDVPFGGYGASGLGREGGDWGYRAYCELKSVLVDTTGGTTAPVFPAERGGETR